MLSISRNLIAASNDIQEKRFSELANEAVASSTNGYKGARRPVSASPFPLKGKSSLSEVHYPTPGTVFRNKDQGGLEKTGNPHHLAITGPGYFVMTPDSMNRTTYTRDGAFNITQTGLVCSVDGLPFAGPGGEAVEVPPGTTEIRCEADGRLLNQKNEVVGQLGIVEFSNIDTLKEIGNNRYISDDTPEPASQSSVVQGALETANINIHHCLSDVQKTQTMSKTLASMAYSINKTNNELVSNLLHIGG